MKSLSPRAWRCASEKKARRRRKCCPELEVLETRDLPAGTWTQLTNVLPPNDGLMLLQTDGSVMVQGEGDNKYWFKLTPGSTGHYQSGAWSQLAPMSTPRLFGGTAVLPSGKVLFVGGEFSGTSSAQNETNTGEIYDPQRNVWAPIASFPQSAFGDDPVEVLADGTVLGGYLAGSQTYLYNPVTDTWAFAANKLRGDTSAEETWIKLPDGSILVYDITASLASGQPRAQRYLPWSQSWVDAGAVPVPLSTSANDELGPAGLLPDGRVFQVGGNNQTALYNPATNSWAVGPSLPVGMGADDAPGAVLPNGHFLFAADHPTYQSPTTLFEFDPIAGTLTPLTVPPALSAILNTTAAYELRMLVVPSGDVLLSTGGPIWDYHPDGAPQASWQPIVSSVTYDGAQTYTLTGTQLNGISEGASYGDDAQMATNYPIVELTSGSTVYFARTFNWTSQVATGSQQVTTQFTLPASVAPGSYTLTVVANGIASAPFAFTTAPGVASSPVAITTATLPAVTAGTAYRQTISAAGGTGSLSFGVAGSLPLGVTLSSNGVLAGTPTLAGSYSFTVTATDVLGAGASQSYTLVVTPAQAARLVFTTQPATTPTGVVLAPIQLEIQDAYGNLLTSDSSDRVSLNVDLGPGSFLSGSSLGAPADNGVATFDNLTLVQPGNYRLEATLPSLNLPAFSTDFAVTPLQVMSNSLAATASGFSLQFNAPYLVNSSTPVLYERGFGFRPSVIVTTDPGNLSDTGAQVEGSLVLDPADKRITFVATNTALEEATGSPLLADGTYTVILRSSAAANGFQALNAGGGFLDGLANGVAGSGDFVTSFVVNAAASGADAVWIPDVADGPGQPLNAPGMNQAGGGYPLYLADGNGVTAVQVTLSYDPNLLQVTGVTGPGFSLAPASTPGQAVLVYSGPTLATTPNTPVTIGYLTAQVPGGTAASPTPYRAEDLLTLSNLSIGGGGHLPVLGTTALHLVAYVGDADGDGAYSSADAYLITRAAVQLDSGFNAFPVVDPVIVADTDGVGYLPPDAALQVNEAGVGVPTATLASPPVPPGVVFQVSSNPPPSRTGASFAPALAQTTGGLPAVRAAAFTSSSRQALSDLAVLDWCFAEPAWQARRRQLEQFGRPL